MKNISKWLPILTLTIVVLAGFFGLWRPYDSKLSEERIVAECKGMTKKFKSLCYTKHIEETLSRYGLSASLELLALAYNADPDFASVCHGNTHDLGKAAHKIFKRTGAIDLTTQVSYCGFGFFHGFMEEMLVEEGSLDGARAFCRYVGETLGRDQQYAEGACYHGIGHGVTDASDPRVWGDAAKMAEPGLSLCRKVATTDEWRLRCASGTFNAISLLYRDPKYKLDAHDEPYALCTRSEYSTSEKKACYAQMNTLVSYLAQGDLAKLFGYPAHITEKEYRNAAMESAATVVSSRRKKYSAEQLIRACRPMPAELSEYCIRGLVGGILEFGTPGSELSEAFAFCESPEMTAGERAECIGQIPRQGEGVYSREQQKMICESIPPDSRPESCRLML